jgi:hypothetical protein
VDWGSTGTSLAPSTRGLVGGRAAGWQRAI